MRSTQNKKKAPVSKEDSSTAPTISAGDRKKSLILLLAILVLLLAVAAWWAQHTEVQKPSVHPAIIDIQPAGQSALVAEFVGMEACVGCHAEQAERFADSHHDLAMQKSTDTSVLGDFNDAVLSSAA